MVIYADILFLVNLYVDYFLLLAVRSFLHLRVKSIRLLAGAALGGGFSLLSLAEIWEPLRIFLAILFAGLMVFAAFAPIKKAALIKAWACFFAFSFIFSGIVLLLSSLTGKAAVVGGLPYFDLSPIMLLTFTVLAYFVSLILDRLRGGREPEMNFCRIIIEHAGKKAELFAKADTGNTLKEPFSGLPVMVAEKLSLSEVFSGDSQGFRLVPYHSIGGAGLLPAFKPDKVYIKKTNRELNCYLALYDGQLSAGSWNCLLSAELVS